MRKGHFRFGLVLAGVAVTLAAPAARQAGEVSRDRLVAAGMEYVAAYQKELAFLLAEEVTVQHVLEPREPSAPAPLASRRTRSEVFITFLDRRRHWTIVRDITEVDGLPVSDRADLTALIATEDTDALARRLFALNARYNIGRVLRNFNDPMLALLALNRFHQPRFSLDVARVDRSDPPVTLATLRFRERERPTLVRSAAAEAVYARGEITLDAATGVVHRAVVTFAADQVEAELTTIFEREERLGLWVPVTFSERYTAADAPGQITEVESRYSNYRRFEVKARIQPSATVR